MENLIEWSYKMQGAREMLQTIIDCVADNHAAKFNLEGGKDGSVYHDAIIRLVMTNPDTINRFIISKGRKIGYRNHKHDKKGKLISCEAYFM